VPSGYDGSTPTPLVMMLHGYGGSATAQEEYFGLKLLAEERGFLYVHPEGTIDSTGRQFWNATDACCDDFAAGIDDSAYLRDVITQIGVDFSVDANNVFIIGHSNGGFMSYRMACDHADIVAAIVSLAAATFADASQCAPANPVSVVEIHGTDDSAIMYDGGMREGRGAFPSAATTVATWAGYDGCAAEPVPSGLTLDLVSDVDGEETAVTLFAGCPLGIDVELWTMEGGEHAPNLSANFGPAVIDFLLSHPKPA
jgi:polyhydroxybutyrate depolymerase